MSSIFIRTVSSLIIEHFSSSYICSYNSLESRAYTLTQRPQAGKVIQYRNGDLMEEKRGSFWFSHITLDCASKFLHARLSHKVYHLNCVIDINSVVSTLSEPRLCYYKIRTSPDLGKQEEGCVGWMDLSNWLRLLATFQTGRCSLGECGNTLLRLHAT